MRLAAIPLVLSAVLLSAPAFAQSGNSGVNQNANYGQQGQYSENNGQYGPNNQTGGGHWHPNQAANNVLNRNNRFTSNENGNFENNGRFGNNEQGVSYDTSQKIRQSLERNGFTNIQVAPEAYVIRAQAPDGQRVVMQVTPDTFAEVVGPGTATGSSTNHSNGNWNGSGSSMNSGSSLNNGNEGGNNMTR